MRLRLLAVSSALVVGGAGLAVGVLALAFLASTATATRAETGKLTFHGELTYQGGTLDCPAGVPDWITCRERHGSGVVPGLGSVSERYLLYHQGGEHAGCPSGTLAVAGLKGALTVWKKGTIEFEAAASPDCQVPEERVTLHYPSVTITGGSGIYAGASGSGTLVQTFIPGTFGGATGKDVWEGTLLVAGLAFDTVAPVLHGATAKTVVRPRGARGLVRVIYRVSATDDTDGAVPVSCIPRTGSRFKLGLTLVNCSATDKSENTAHGRFTVTVRARR